MEETRVAPFEIRLHDHAKICLEWVRSDTVSVTGPGCRDGQRYFFLGSPAILAGGIVKFVKDAANLTSMSMQSSKYRGYRFPPEIISYAVWLYHRFGLKFQRR